MKDYCKGVKCPFYRDFRDFTVRFCDNLVSGVPACVVANFYPDSPSMDYPADVVVCSHFVRSDVYNAVKESGCFFGGLCVHPKSHGFSACRPSCSRLHACI